MNKSHQRTAITILITAIATVCVADDSDPNAVSIIYDPSTRSLVFDGASDLTSLEVVSASGILNGQRPDSLNGTFDVHEDDLLFKLDADGFPSLLADGILTETYTLEELESDLTIDGSFVGGGGVGAVSFSFVPEPKLARVAGGIGNWLRCPP